MEIIVNGLSAFGLHITPVEMMVVNECAIHEDTTVWIQRTRDHVRSIGSSAVILRRPRSSLGIRFHNEAREVGDTGVDLIDGSLPPLGDPRIKGIKCL